jgi:type II secretory pathway pseudopilin PulG
MRMRNRQRGITLLGMVITISVAGVFAYCGMKIFPMYQEFWAVQESMEEVAKTPNIANASRGKVVDLLSRRFDISYVESIKDEHITIDPKAGPLLTITYEVRKPLMYNLDIVGKFTHSVKLSGT